MLDSNYGQGCRVLIQGVIRDWGKISVAADLKQGRRTICDIGSVP